MNTKSNLRDEQPLVCEFSNKTDAVNYDEWFRAKVNAALNSGKTVIPHDEVVAGMRAKRSEGRRAQTD